MNFIERWWGVSPDGGSGISEVCIILAAVFTLTSLFFSRDKLLGIFYYQRSRNVILPK